MKETKREILPLYSFYDRSGVSRHLEEMAAQGWLLEKLNGWYWQYRRTEPQTLSFTVTYFPKASQFSPIPTEGLETFWEFCAEAGWVLAADNAQVQVFYNKDPNAIPIETDPKADFETIHRTMKRSTVSSFWSLLVLSLLECVFLFWQLFDNPIDRFSSPLFLCSTFAFVPLLLLSVIELVRYYRWRKRCLAALETGDPLPELGSARALSILILTLTGLQLVFLLSFSLQASPSMAITLICILIYSCLMFVLADFVRKLLRRLRVKSWVNLVVTIGIIALLTVGMMGGIIALVFRTSGSFLNQTPEYETYEVNDFTFRVYHDELPLTVQNLAATDYDRYSTELTVSSSIFLTHIEADQRSRLGDGDHPDLQYEVVVVKAPFLYNLCKNEFIDWLERDNDQLPEEYWDEYRPVDPSPWGALEVYQWYSSGEPYNRFLICWPDRIAEIDYEWDWVITDEIMSISAEKLKNA